MGGCPGCGRVSGVRGQSHGSGTVSGSSSGLGCEIRCCRREVVSRSGSHRPAQPSSPRWRQRRRRGDQGIGAGTSESDLDPSPSDRHAARQLAGVLPGRAGDVPQSRRPPRRSGRFGGARPCSHSQGGRPAQSEQDHRNTESRWTPTQHRRARPRDPGCPARPTARSTRGGSRGVRGRHPRHGEHTDRAH
jgi:hypothetical protein